jgi:Zn-dependent M32 family carboxypeptidase
MNTDHLDPRDIPILTTAVDESATAPAAFDSKALHAAILDETLQLADSLLHQAAKDIEAILFEKVFDQLRAQLPEMLDRILKEDAISKKAADSHG